MAAHVLVHFSTMMMMCLLSEKACSTALYTVFIKEISQDAPHPRTAYISVHGTDVSSKWHHCTKMQHVRAKDGSVRAKSS